MTSVSVIIPVFNEEKVILDCLESLGRQSYSNFEIIAVDDGSSDETLKIIQNLQSLISDLQVLRQEHKGPGAARNLGASNARGKVLVFVDADMTFDKDFIKNLVGPVIKGEVKGTFSKEEYVSNWENVWARCWNINEGWPEKLRHPKNYPDTQKVFRALLKSEFDRVGGFDPSGEYTDDWSLSQKLEYEASKAIGAKFYHKNPDNLKEVYTQAKWVSKRQYKFGLVGETIALIRLTFPFTLFFGVTKAFNHKEPRFLTFKAVYDHGAFMGILEKLLFLKKVK